jgi:cytoskeletal protein RodZ
VIALGAVALLSLAAGCGSDKSGETTAATQVSVPAVTSPLPTASTTASTTIKQKTAPTTTSTGGTAACTIPDTYQHFTYNGLDCSSALAVAKAWDADGKDCNTVDNPNVQAGYQRTCTVNGFSCTAKRDVHSDGRFVTCTQGAQTVRFTWLPA